MINWLSKTKDKLYIFCFKRELEQYGVDVVKVKGWGMFLVEGKGVARRTVWFDWWRGFI